MLDVTAQISNGTTKQTQLCALTAIVLDADGNRAAFANKTIITRAATTPRLIICALPCRSRICGMGAKTRIFTRR